MRHASTSNHEIRDIAWASGTLGSVDPFVNCKFELLFSRQYIKNRLVAIRQDVIEYQGRQRPKYPLFGYEF